MTTQVERPKKRRYPPARERAALERWLATVDEWQVVDGGRERSRLPTADEQLTGRRWAMPEAT